MCQINYVEPKYLRSLYKAGGEDLMLRITAMFREHFTIKLNSVENAADADDFSQVKVILHSMKSSSGAVGAIGLFKYIAQIEQLIKTGEISEIDQMISNLKSGFDSTNTEIEKLSHEICSEKDDSGA